MAFFEQIWVGVAAEEFHDVPEFLIGRLISNREDVLEVFVGRPNLMPAQVDALVKAMSTRHALKVHSIEFAATPERKVISDFINDFEGHNFVLVASGLVQVVLVEQRSLGNFPRLWVDHGTPNHPFASNLESNAFQRRSCCIIEGSNGFTVEI